MVYHSWKTPNQLHSICIIFSSVKPKWRARKKARRKIHPCCKEFKKLSTAEERGVAEISDEGFGGHKKVNGKSSRGWYRWGGSKVIRDLFLPCLQCCVCYRASYGDQSLFSVPVLLGTGALLLSVISRWFRVWFKGTLLNKTSFPRPVLHFRLATITKVIYGVVTRGHSFYLWVSKVEWNPPNLNNSQGLTLQRASRGKYSESLQ